MREKQRASNENVIDMLNTALIPNCEYIIITEDDFYPIDNFYNELIHTIRLLPKNWRTLHLCPGGLWGRSLGEPDEPGKLRWEGGTEPNIPYHESKRFYINGEDNLFLQHGVWLGSPTCFLIQQKNIPNFIKEYKTYNFDDACDVILTQMLSSNDFICRDPLLGYEKSQGPSVFDENLKEYYSPGNNKDIVEKANEIVERYELKYDLEKTENPYSENNQKLLWPSQDEVYLKTNWPNTFNFDDKIKEDIVNESRKLPLNSAIIDCGAHIGDGAVPIAGALKSFGREDIIVYAIDPGKEKVDFITEMRDKNNLNNLRILNYGLSDKNIVYNHIKRNEEDHWGDNTGGTEWIDSQSEKADINSESIEFKKLDDLVNSGEIPEKIGYIHLDVEGMEDKAILGGKNTILKYRPILSLEEHDENSRKLNDILEPLGYSQINRKNSNNIYHYSDIVEKYERTWL